MRYSVLAVAALAGLTNAQISSLPSCAQPCVNTFVSGGNIAGCSSLNIACICGNSDFLSSIACCLAAACSAADQASTITFAHDLCSTNGVTNLPTAIVCSSTSAAASTSSSASSSVSEASVTTTSSGTASDSSSGSSTGTPTTTGASTKAASTTKASTSASSSSSASASAAATKNASPQNVANVGAGILGGLAALLL